MLNAELPTRNVQVHEVEPMEEDFHRGFHEIEDHGNRDGFQELLFATAEEQEAYARRVWARAPIRFGDCVDGLCSSWVGALIAVPVFLAVIPVLVSVASGLFFLEYIQDIRDPAAVEREHERLPHP